MAVILKVSRETMPRTKAIETPEELETLFNRYIVWVNKNPYKVHDFVGKDAKEVRKEKQRPVTWIGFEAWLYDEGIVTQLTHYEQNTGNSYSEYLPIIRACKRKCSSDIIAGALSGVYNQNIAAHLEGLKDVSEIKHEGIGFLNIDPLSDDSANNGTQEDSKT